MQNLTQLQMLESLDKAAESGAGAAMVQGAMGIGLGMYGSRMVGQTVGSAMQHAQTQQSQAQQYHQQQQSQGAGKFCPECGTRGDQAAKFCLECGHKFATTGCSCGAEIKPGQKFCMECGSKL